jgi:hypothetical protein
MRVANFLVSLESFERGFHTRNPTVQTGPGNILAEIRIVEDL